MNPNRRPPRIVYVSTYVPKECGLATYTHHLRHAVEAAKGTPSALDPVVAISREDELGDYSEPWQWPLVRTNPDDYRKLADQISQSDVDIVSLQHEFGIFGGEAGSDVLKLLERIDKPVVTTFHTVFENRVEPYATVQAKVAERSDHVLVMNRKAIHHLHECFGIATDKISFIPHGSPVPNRASRSLTRQLLGWDNRKVLFTFGLLSRSKGIEFALRAIAEAAAAIPDLLYVIAGATHPEVRRNEGEAYRKQLIALVQELGLSRHVQMIDRYIPETELASLITAADLYITPYPGMQQITSGTLAYAVGLGRPFLSTPYSYARDLVQNHEEMLLPYGDATAWSTKIIELFAYPGMLDRWERIIADIGRTMQWPQVGAQHLRLFERLAARPVPARQEKVGVADVG